MMNYLMQDINQLNVTMQVMQTNIGNYIASNDLTIKTINDSLQYVAETPIILVPSSDEIDHHRSEFS